MPGLRKMVRSPIRSVSSINRKMPGIEELEARTLLSASAVIPASLLDLVAHPSVSAASITNPSKSPLPPNSIRSAYGVNLIQFPNGSGGFIKGDGTGETIAIADAYNDPNIVSDLQLFDATFGLANPPSFTVLNENGGTNLSGVANSPKSSWALEESLDVEWSHTIAPAANIVLFEANSANNIDLDIADQTAATAATYSALGIPAAGVVSNSFGSTEGTDPTQDETQADEQYEDTNYFQPISASGAVTVVASAGDYGNQSYPAASPYVLSVGGSTLALKTGPFGVSYSSETAWSTAKSRSSPTGFEGTGGGTSLFEPEPTYQTDYGINNTGGFRATPDVSMDANPSSGVYITDTYDFPGDSAIGSIGGTSLAAPLWAGLLAITNQGRALAGDGVLANAQEAVYSVPSSDFHDITSGHNIVATAGPGYDEVTGIGTPIANKLVSDLVNATTGPVVVPGAVTYDDSQGIPSNLTASIDTNDAAHAAANVVGIPSAAANISVTVTNLAQTSQELAASANREVTVSLPGSSQVFRTDSAVATSLAGHSATTLDSFHGASEASVVTTAADTLPTASVQTALPKTISVNGAENSSAPLPAIFAGTASDAVFVDFGSQSLSENRPAEPTGPVIGEDSQSVDLALAAGLVFALGGSWNIRAQDQATRKYPALRG